MEPFTIIITTSGKKYRMTVERKYVTNDLERYEVRANNHQFQFDVNRPVLLKLDLIHLPWEWKLDAGNCPLYFQREIQKEMEWHLRRK
jgi:hypothetical protein